MQRQREARLTRMAQQENPFEDPEVQALMNQHGIVHAPGSADALMREIKPLLLADGIDLDNPDVDLTLDELNTAMARAVDQHNALLFMPNDAERTRSLQVLYEFTEAFAESGSDAATLVHDTVHPEATASRPAASHVMGTGLGLIDTWYTDAALAASLRNVPIGKWRGGIRNIAIDLQSLARSGRAFDSLGSFIMRYRGAAVSRGIALLVASTVAAVAGREGSTIAATFSQLTGHSPKTPARGTGVAFGLNRDNDAPDVVIEAFSEWLMSTVVHDSEYVDAATEMLVFVQELASSHGFSLDDPDDIPDIVDVLDELDDERLRDGGLDVLRDFVAFQTHEGIEDWEPLIGLVDDALMSNDPVHLALESAYDTTISEGIEALDHALAATTVVSGVSEFMHWLGTSQPITSTGALRRADIKAVATMIGVAAEGVAKVLPDDRNQPIPQTSVWQALSMREVTPLDAWWESLQVTEIIELTASRVRPGPAVAEEFHGNEPSSALSATLCANYIAQVLTSDLLDEVEPLFMASSLASCELAVDLLLQAITPEGEPAPQIASASQLHTMLQPRALQSIQYLADANILTLTEGKVTAEPVMHGIIADGVKATLRILEMVLYMSTLSQD